jgi:hypothetical protein
LNLKFENWAANYIRAITFNRIPQSKDKAQAVDKNHPFYKQELHFRLCLWLNKRAVIPKE